MKSLLEVTVNREPYEWSTDESKRFMGKDYLGGSATVQERVKVIADGAEVELGIEGFSEKLERAVANGWVSFSTPNWCNSWANRGLPISCFGSYIEDSMQSILYKNAEVGMMSKVGGGTSAYFGNLRARGENISTGGQSFGPIHFMELFKTTTKIVSQGSTRRGSCAAYLDIEHPDIEEFLRINSPDHIIQDFSFGVNVSDKWLEEMDAGDKAKRSLWAKIIKKRFETGYPYILFIDNINNNAPQVYKDKGLRISASNLCLTGDTKIVIADDLNGLNSRKVSLADFCAIQFEHDIYVKSCTSTFDDKWCLITAKAKTGETDELIEIESELGNIIRCTPEHQILTKNRGWVQAQNLKEDDILVE